MGLCSNPPVLKLYGRDGINLSQVKLQLKNKKKPRLLLCLPIFPQDSFNGPSKRGHAWVTILAEHFDISLLVIGILGPDSLPPSNLLLSNCNAIVSVSITKEIKKIAKAEAPFMSPDYFGTIDRLTRHEVKTKIAELKRTLGIVEFDAVLLYSLGLELSLVSFLASIKPYCMRMLDVDELPSATRKKFHDFYTHINAQQPAKTELQLSIDYLEKEKQRFARYDVIFLSSQTEIAQFNLSHSKPQTALLPNSVSKHSKRAVYSEKNHYALLFVGNFNYEPNQDAIEYFDSQILPTLREATDKIFSCRIVGTGNIEAVSARCKSPEIEFVGFVEDLSDQYLNADICFIPLRTGGGTRLKILEAASFGVPIVSSSVGQEGLDFVNEISILTRDKPEEFAEACAELLNNAEKRKRIAKAALNIFDEKYSHEAVSKQFESQLPHIYEYWENRLSFFENAKRKLRNFFY